MFFRVRIPAVKLEHELEQMLAHFVLVRVRVARVGGVAEPRAHRLVDEQQIRVRVPRIRIRAVGAQCVRVRRSVWAVLVKPVVRVQEELGFGTH